MTESRKKVTAKTVVKGHQETFRARLITLTVTLIYRGPAEGWRRS